MRGLVRRVVTIGLALAFAVSGATWRYCAAAPSAKQNAVAVHQGHDPSDHHAHHADHHTTHSADAVGDHAASHADAAHESSPPGTDHACGKCCSICTVASVMPATLDAPLAFIVSSLLFSCEGQHCSGRSISVDPGIPKRIA